MLFKFPSIGQFSQFVSRNKNRVDEKLHFTGLIKLHGSNMGVGYNEKCGLWFQSHKRIITPESDNYKAAATMTENKDAVQELMFSIAESYSIDLKLNTLMVYGEWCGSNIQKNVAIAGLPIMLVIFDIAYVLNDEIKGEETELKWVNMQKFNIPVSLNKLVYNILDFPTYSLEMDFNKLPEIRNMLVKLTEDVEHECPAGKYFGKSGIGEGIVWRCQLDGKVFRFKVKGDEHATSKVTTMAAVDVEKLKTLDEFVEKSVTENRLLQGISEIFGNEEKSSAWFQRVGKFISWVVTDVKKEDMESFPFDVSDVKIMKDLNKAISEKCKRWFKQYVELF